MDKEKIAARTKGAFDAMASTPRPFLAGAGLSALAAYLLVFTSVWWLALVAGAIGGLFAKKGYVAFLAGFLGTGAGWLVHFIALALGSDLAVLNLLFGLVGINVGGIAMLSVAIGALLGGFGALNAAFVRDLCMGGNGEGSEAPVA